LRTSPRRRRGARASARSRSAGGSFAFVRYGGARAGLSAKPLDGERDAFLALPGVRPAPYLGRFGWLALEVADEEALARARVLLGQSYERFARGRGRRRQRPRTDTAAPTGREGR
jgi:predicted DNA-binding protein (MmcQ/YjbR family)